MHSDAGMTTTITVPEGAAPGFKMKCTTPDGAEVQLTLPMGIAPGSTIQLKKDDSTGLWTMAEPATTTTNQVALAAPLGSYSSMTTASMPTTTISAIPTTVFTEAAAPRMIDPVAVVGTTSYIGAAATAPSACYVEQRTQYTAPAQNVYVERRPSYTPPVVLVDQSMPTMPAMMPMQAGFTPLPQVLQTQIQAPSFVEVDTMCMPSMVTSGPVTTMAAFPAGSPYVAPAPGTIVRTPSYTPPPGSVVVQRTPSYTPPVVEVMNIPSAPVTTYGGVAQAMPSATVLQPQYQQPVVGMNPGMMPMQPAMGMGNMGMGAGMPGNMGMGAGIPYSQYGPGAGPGAGVWPGAGKGAPWPGGPPGGDWGYGKGGKGEWGAGWFEGKGMYNADGSKGCGGKGGFVNLASQPWMEPREERVERIKTSAEEQMENEPWMDMRGQWHQGKGR